LNLSAELIHIDEKVQGADRRDDKNEKTAAEKQDLAHD
jgi:hypothetical protein